MRLVLLLFLIVGLTSCAHTKNHDQVKIKKLEAKLKKQNRAIKKLKKTKQISKKAKAKKKKTKPIVKSPKVSVGEKKLYANFEKSFREGRKEDALRALRMLRKVYPKSPMIAEAYYLIGKSWYAKKDYKRSLKNLSVVTKHFKHSPKYRTAILAKAVIYKEMNLEKPARSLFSDLRKRFPKSSEAYRANLHLKLMASADKGK